MSFVWTVAWRLLREGRFQTVLILAGVWLLSRPAAEVAVSDIHE